MKSDRKIKDKSKKIKVIYVYLEPGTLLHSMIRFNSLVSIEYFL